MSIIRYTLTLVFSSLLFSLSSQVLTPVKWEMNVEHLSGDEYNLVYKANIKKNWNVYSQFTSDDGPVPTSITYENIEGASLIGKATEKGYKKEGHDPLFDVNVVKFLDKEPFIITSSFNASDLNSNPSFKWILSFSKGQG